MNFDNPTIKIEGVEHEWLETPECDYENCKKEKGDITWCDECEIAFCQRHVDYTNDYEQGLTYCPDCWSLKQKVLI